MLITNVFYIPTVLKRDKKDPRFLSIVGQNGPNEVDMEALTAKPFITDENNASSLVILLFFAHSAKIIYPKIVTSRCHLLVGERSILAYLDTLA